ncbi:head-tail connector protein [Staphylococcus xylosus]|uniref:head-tail connector protein n=1 Tax=Staphylococcus xylosus TaxID=1288 RepID=UPI0003FED1C7|nr:head-tail connector protein [Staphylococcus xylosus]MBM6637497.1 phage gp6-like head-tail connector protein [Staphylococcus xylosus]
MFNIDSVESIKKSIRVDYDIDDDEIMYVFLPNAIDSIKTAVSLNESDEPFFKDNPTFNRLVLITIAHMQDNRSQTSNEQSFDNPSYLSGIQTLRAKLAKWRSDNLEVIADES